VPKTSQISGLGICWICLDVIRVVRSKTDAALYLLRRPWNLFVTDRMDHWLLIAWCR